MTTDDLFDDPRVEAILDFYATCRGKLAGLIDEFAERENIDENQTAGLLLDLALIYRTMDYLVRTEKPTASGLKLDYGRIRKEFDELVRFAKKEADKRIALATEAIEATEGGPKT